VFALPGGAKSAQAPGAAGKAAAGKGSKGRTVAARD
jgi:hypothetical protein